MSPPPGSARRNRSRHRGAGLDESLEMVAAPAAGTPPRRRRRVAAEQCAAPAVASPRNGRRARRRLEKEIEVEDDAARRARRRKSTRAAATKAAPAAADKVATAAAADKEDTSMALVLASTDAIRGQGNHLLLVLIILGLIFASRKSLLQILSFALALVVFGELPPRVRSNRIFDLWRRC